MFSISIYKTTQALPADWDKYIPAGHCLESAQLNIIETVQTKDVTPYYIHVTDGNNTVLCLYAQMLQLKPYHIQSAIDNKLIEYSAKSLVKLFPVRLLVIGNLFRHDGKHCHVCMPQLSPQEMAKIYDDSIALLQKETCCLATLVKDTNEFQINYFKEKNYVQYDNDISMQMPINAGWETLKDYEKALKHKYSQRLRKIKKSFTDVTIKELNISEIDHLKEQIEVLYLQVAKKQNVSLGLLNGDYFLALKKVLGDRYKVFGMFYEGKMIAFTSAIVNGTYDMNYIGFDYAYNHKLNLYFNILFHCIEEAIKNKTHTLILGRTALEAKAVLGCKPVYLKSMYRVNNRALAFITQQISNKTIAEQGETWKTRHPFKEHGDKE